MSYTQLYLHVVIVVKRRIMAIPPNVERHIYSYIVSILKERGVYVVQINGIPNHIHMLLRIPSTVCVADLVRDVKRATSLMIKNTLRLTSFEGWSAEYAAFTVSKGVVERVINYIRNQKEHHLKLSFEDEFMKMLEPEEQANYNVGNFDK